jgi:hypothetical protein
MVVTPGSVENLLAVYQLQKNHLTEVSLYCNCYFSKVFFVVVLCTSYRIYYSVNYLYYQYAFLFLFICIYF